MEAQPLTREKIIRNVHCERNFNRLMLLSFVLLVLQFIAMMKLFDNVFLAYGTVFLMFVVYMLILCKVWYRWFGNYHLKLNEDLVFSQILWVAAKENFRNVQFDPQGRISDAAIWAPGFPFTENSTVYRADHYARAMWEAIPLELQHMRLGVWKTGYNLSPSGGEAATCQELNLNFKGMIYLCHLGMPFTPTTVHTGKPLAGEIKTGDDAFDRLFSVRTQDPGTMPLSDGMRRFLVESVGKCRGKVYIHFARNGDIYLAFHQKIHEGTPLRDTKGFERLDRQACIVKEMLNGFTRGS